jgi:stage IV sporulation protein A
MNNEVPLHIYCSSIYGRGIFMDKSSDYNLYKDIQTRTGGEIYLGVVGPVRTGKSTFIKRFMDLCVLPGIEDEHARMRARDELPQSAAGKTIMTTEPKFIPKEAVEVQISPDVAVKVRMIDCVGFMVPGSEGHMEGEAERMVKTPWFDYEIPFTQAAEMGTKKVITDHATIGIVVTSDGSFGELPRENYIEPEERTVEELKRLGKPFVILLNSEKPYSEAVTGMAAKMEEKYQVSVIPVNCEQLRREDVTRILEQILYEFPLAKVEFYIPRWVEMLPANHKIKAELIEGVRNLAQNLTAVRDVNPENIRPESEYIERVKLDEISMDSGTVRVRLDLAERYYYELLSEMTGREIAGEYELMALIRELSGMQKEYAKVETAVTSVRQKGYGVILPERSEITLAEPELIHQGGKFGVKIRSEAPSVHLIRANIETEIAPIVGSEEQARDLIAYLKDGENSPEGIWSTNIFGKSVEELVEDGIRNKIFRIGDESQVKLQDTMQKIVNDSSGGLVCIII